VTGIAPERPSLQSTGKGHWWDGRELLAQTPSDTTFFNSTARTGWYHTIPSFDTGTLKFVVTFPKEPESDQRAPYANTFELRGWEYNTDAIAQHQD